MADIKVSEMVSADSINLEDLLMIIQNGENSDVLIN